MKNPKPRTGEARKSVGKARKSEPARELLIFEFLPSRGVKSAFRMCQIMQTISSRYEIYWSAAKER